MKETKEFRIMTNGYMFRVEQRVIERFLWWTWNRWRMVDIAISLKEADKDVARLKSIHEWREVTNGPGH